MKTYFGVYVQITQKEKKITQGHLEKKIILSRNFKYFRYHQKNLHTHLEQISNLKYKFGIGGSRCKHHKMKRALNLNEFRIHLWQLAGAVMGKSK